MEIVPSFGISYTRRSWYNFSSLWYLYCWFFWNGASIWWRCNNLFWYNCYWGYFKKTIMFKFFSMKKLKNGNVKINVLKEMMKTNFVVQHHILQHLLFCFMELMDLVQIVVQLQNNYIFDVYWKDLILIACFGGLAVCCFCIFALCGRCFCWRRLVFGVEGNLVLGLRHKKKKPNPQNW